VVEGRGADVCALLVGYSDKQLQKSGILDVASKGHAVLLSGGHDAMGNEKESLDVISARETILKLKETVSAFAISSMFATRNSQHELQLRDLVKELTDKPVACGHELANNLGAPQRALTAVLNARMIPYIKELIKCVKSTLESLNIAAPLMIVKGDGSLVNTATALEQPVTTVLSGPAASVIGACALSGLKNAIVADMGGTTTDIAIVRDGQPQLSSDGAKVGNWKPMIEAVKVFCVGLGGDSEVLLKGANNLSIGPRRVVPMCLLAKQHPWIITRLKQQLAAYPNARNNKFVVALDDNEVLLQQLSSDEFWAWELLCRGPIELEEAKLEDSNLAKSLAKLQRLGLAIYSGFTPTDAAHVLGLSDHLDTQASILAAKIWASQMRCLYGVGNWQRDDAVGPSQEVYDLVIARINATLIEASLNHSGKLKQAHSSALTELLTSLIISKNNPDDALFDLRFCQQYPLVAVGAPAASYYPKVAEDLSLKLHLPAHAQVANAFGAVMGAVIQRTNVTISQPTVGVYRLYYKATPLQFNDLALAIKSAGDIAQTEAIQLAEKAGASSIEVQLTQNANHIEHDLDGELFLDTVITATATGRPNVEQMHSS
jgi:N-methylhydantoinase A/oxoprolinase/acetone carboxylase beta subunit